MIERLDSLSARKISAGQVITDLCSALKELLENSLDACAKNVAVRLIDYGETSISVDDDGTGIDTSDLIDMDAGIIRHEASTPLLAHRATTKNRGSESDVAVTNADGSDDVNFLGFRGEALHSLAHMCELSVMTMSSKTEPFTTEMYYDHKADHTVLSVSRQRHHCGTSVTVANLFKNFPVRHREFCKNKRKQLLKACNIVRQYAVSHPSLRLVMSHQEKPDSAPVTLVSLTGSNDLERSIAEAYGSRCLSSMSRIEWDLSFGTISGFLSKVDGGGRMGSDQQVFSLDSRPVDLPRLAKAINDSFVECLPNASKRLLVGFFLQIKMKSRDSSYDVNLVPNKRKVLIANEEKIVEEVRERSLQHFRNATDGIFFERDDRVAKSQGNITRLSQKINESLVPISATSLTQYVFKRDEVPESSTHQNPTTDHYQADLTPSDDIPWSQLRELLYTDGAETASTEKISQNDDTQGLRGAEELPPLDQSEESQSEDSAELEQDNFLGQPLCKRFRNEDEKSSFSVSNKLLDDEDEDDDTIPNSSKEMKQDARVDFFADESKELYNAAKVTETGSESSSTEEVEISILTDEGNQPRERGTVSKLTFPDWTTLASQNLFPSAPTMDSTLSRTLTGKSKKGRGTKSSTSSKPIVSDLRGQTNAQLALYFAKSSFKDMVILGQFNHGFIVARLESEIFIIDQHAADEKYNYERLMSNYKATPQPMVKTVPISMNIDEVELAIAHSEELYKHGFKVTRSTDDANVLMVHTVPVLPYDVVMPQDVIELIQQIVHYSSIIKPLRSVWHSMATKACRTSIMIGTALSEKTMRSIVSRLSGLDQPWSCPHGRPTMRRLCDTESLCKDMRGLNSFQQPENTVHDETPLTQS